MFPGFPTRLENDIRNLYKKNILKGDKDTKLKFDIEVIVINFLSIMGIEIMK